jgi:hypothetical protein
MDRLCERPGCSEPASVSYGMRPEDLVFWLDRFVDGQGADHGVLCRRHADSMVVPRGWTLNDLRDPDLHLFRPPDPSARVRPRRSPRPAPDRQAGEQLRLDDDPPGPWTPSFDEADDLGGLLSARSPLLSRAFRTAERTDG